MKVGKYEVSAHNLGFFRLDGGSMFGSVPKNLWSRLLAADEDNCIKLATRCLLIRGAQQTILVDVGLGEKWNDKLRAIFAIDNMPRAEWGFDTEDITDIVLTHLHFDHAGGITRYRGKGSEVELCFPQARVWLQRSNYNNACDPNPREKASY